ncbi:MAG: tripartite tricarboxylate transporter substrate binding protein [Acetobacteraceae bacterium]|nr:tripartite tricarboxylate transporter substrate binding protein [Acetobacteraceae bacterium]
MIQRRALPLLPLTLPVPARAQAPRSLHIFVGAAPGGGFDALARSVEAAGRAAGLLSEVTVEHVPGAGGTVGLPRFAAQRRGRGDALMIGGAVLMGAAISNRSPMTLRDVTPIARLIEEPGVIVSPAGGDLPDMPALLAALRANSGAVPVAGGSAGGFDHIIWGRLIQAVGGSPRAAAYVAFPGGGPARAAILGRQVRAGIAGWAEFAEDIRAGRMRALATTAAERVVPEVPTLRDGGVDLAAANWRGVFAPPGIGAPQREGLIALIRALAATPAWQEQLRLRSWDGALLLGDDFARFLAAEEQAMTAVLRDLGLA